MSARLKTSSTVIERYGLSCIRETSASPAAWCVRRMRDMSDNPPPNKFVLFARFRFGRPFIFSDMKEDSAGGISLIASALGMVTTMALHPTGREIVRGGDHHTGSSHLFALISIPRRIA